jgi:quercetin dioxygenase-like cupin family protein
MFPLAEDRTMKWTKRIAACLLAAVVYAPSGGIADDRGGHGDGHLLVTPDKLQWAPSPVLPPGAMAALVAGNPAKEGEMYAIRIKFPDGYKVPPHWHPADENVTVLQGTLRFGVGEQIDESRTADAPAGSFAHMPKGVRHFAMAKGDTVVHIQGLGPFGINYVHPSDDPRKK